LEKIAYKFLVVYEDLYNNKESFKTNKIGDTINSILDNYNLKVEDGRLDIEKLNSDDPYDVGTIGLGFYDIDVYDNDGECEGNGKIMIFYIGDEDDEDASIIQYNDYLKELADLKIKMIKAEIFAKKFPMFKDYILRNKMIGEEKENRYIEFGKRYKDLYLAWGIRRVKYSSKYDIYVTNYEGEDPDRFLFSLYFNSVSLFDSMNDFGLETLQEKAKVFFFDKPNSTFYVEDEHIEQFLEEANKWVIKAQEMARQEKIDVRRKQLEEELKRLDNEKDE